MVRSMTAYTIDFEPIGRRGQCRDDESLLDCGRQLGAGIVSVCGGLGKCQSCKVQVVKGSVSEPSSNEREVFSPQELQDGWHLACQAYPASDCKVSVPPESMATPQRTQVEGLQVTVPPEPPVRAYQIKLPVPTLVDLLADADSLLETVNQQHQLQCHRIDVDVLRALSPQLRSWNWQCQASVRNGEVIALSTWPGVQLGLAIDLGTTKVAGYLVDLSDGRTLAARGVMNPQISYGEDIISRVAHVVASPAEGAHLQKLAVEALNELAADLCAAAGADVDRIVESVVVGNTAMHHLLVGLPVRQLALSPFVPAVSGALDIKARDLGLSIAPGAYVHLLPNIAGFVGSDHVAMLLATEVWQAEGLVLALDIGTNTEVSLVDNGKITAVSCASGPAFEGGQIKDGMRAAGGAIERLRIEDDSVQYRTVDEAAPVGICGSGVLDAMAQLYLAGAIDERGRMKDTHPLVRTHDEQREFVLVGKESRDKGPDIVITQGDVRELQLAKAAIRTGIQTLLEAQGRSEEEISQVIIAGAFGTYIDLSSALTVGMLPSLPLDRFRQVGNAAGMGSRLALISLEQRAQAQTIASRVHYIELSTAPNFTDTFVQASYIGRYRIAHGKREAIE
ncbi:MAG: DUF4445 domain-containing protein [Dehalococcoidia bacterium]|nr:DUF4445 domain-containing protein [Dehalococcoidia bacterium]